MSIAYYLLYVFYFEYIDFNTDYKNIFLLRLKEYMKKQKMAEIRAEKEQKKLIKNRVRSDFDAMNELNSQRSGVLTFKGRMKPSPTFSDIVGTTTKKHGSTVCRKALAKKAASDFKVVEVKKIEK